MRCTPARCSPMRTRTRTALSHAHQRALPVSAHSARLVVACSAQTEAASIGSACSPAPPQAGGLRIDDTLLPCHVSFAPPPLRITPGRLRHGQPGGQVHPTFDHIFSSTSSSLQPHLLSSFSSSRRGLARRWRDLPLLHAKRCYSLHYKLLGRCRARAGLFCVQKRYTDAF